MKELTALSTEPISEQQMDETLGPTRSTTLKSNLPFLMESCSDHITRKLNEKLKDLNISLRHFYLIAVLDELGPKAQNDLATLINTNNNTIVQLLDDLEELHIAERRRNPDNRRQHLVTLTNEGSKTLKRARTLINSSYDRLLGALEKSEREALIVLLSKVVTA
jgi:DNA-binding MarR family transcriptional regulator